MDKYAIIVAGGSGTRMGLPIPKQYLEIGGKPIVMQTLSKFYQTDRSIHLVLVLPKQDFDFWKSLCEKYEFQVPHQVVSGGNSRFQSVSNGLDAIKATTGTVAIHDAVRPFVKPEVIMESFRVSRESGSAIPVIPVKDSIRLLTDDGKSFYRDRGQFRLVQTPQTFDLEKIKTAFQVEESPQFTDDATVYEHQGWQVKLIAGNPENIKITSPEDLDYANFLIQRGDKD